MALQGGTLWVKDFFLTAPPFMIILACFFFLCQSSANTLFTKSEGFWPSHHPLTNLHLLPNHDKKKKSIKKNATLHRLFFLFLTLFVFLSSGFSFCFSVSCVLSLFLSLGIQPSFCRSYCQRQSTMYVWVAHKDATFEKHGLGGNSALLLFTEPDILFNTVLPVVCLILAGKTGLQWPRTHCAYR